MSVETKVEGISGVNNICTLLPYEILKIEKEEPVVEEPVTEEPDTIIVPVPEKDIKSVLQTIINVLKDLLKIFS